jgi:hypothetical protein
MKKITFLFGILLVAGLGIILNPKTASASEGYVEIASTTRDKNNRCYALSVSMDNQSFRILVTCRDLIYPPNSDLVSYIVWARPIDGALPKRLGKLGIGKAEFRTQDAFSSLFITTEKEDAPKTPEGQIVMQGDVRPIGFLTKPASPTPTIKNNGGETASEQGDKVSTDTSKLSVRDKVILGLKRAGLVSVLGIIAIMGLVFVITRSRG